MDRIASGIKDCTAGCKAKCAKCGQSPCCAKCGSPCCGTSPCCKKSIAPVKPIPNRNPGDPDFNDSDGKTLAGRLLRGGLEIFKHTIRYELGKALIGLCTTNVSIVASPLVQGVDLAAQTKCLVDLSKLYRFSPVSEERARLLLQHGGVYQSQLTGQAAGQLRDALAEENILAEIGGGLPLPPYTLKASFASLEEGSEYWEKDVIEVLRAQFNDFDFQMPGATSFDPDTLWVVATAAEAASDPRTFVLSVTLSLEIMFHEYLKLKLDGTQWYAPDIEIATAKGRELGVRNLRISGEFTVDSGRSQELEPEPGSSEPYVDPTEFAFTVKLHVMNAEDDPPEVDWELDVKAFFGGMKLPDYLEETLPKEILLGLLTQLTPEHPLVIRYENGGLDVQTLLDSIKGDIKGGLKAGLCGACHACSYRDCIETCCICPAALGTAAAVDVITCQPCAKGDASREACSACPSCCSCCCCEDSQANGNAGGIPPVSTAQERALKSWEVRSLETVAASS